MRPDDLDRKRTQFYRVPGLFIYSSTECDHLNHTDASSYVNLVWVFLEANGSLPSSFLNGNFFPQSFWLRLKSILTWCKQTRNCMYISILTGDQRCFHGVLWGKKREQKSRDKSRKKSTTRQGLVLLRCSEDERRRSKTPRRNTAFQSSCSSTKSADLVD